MNLIFQLKQEHLSIMRSLEFIKFEITNGKSRNSGLINELREFKNTLVTHLELEDKLLYPALSNSKNKKSRELGKKFSEEMLGISQITFAFFGKYMSETISDLLQNSEFKKEFEIISQAITKRVIAEENILFPLYEKYCEKIKEV